MKSICFVALLASGQVFGATYQTVNFTVTAESPAIAQQVAEAAEMYRRQLAIFWLGKPLPNWSRPCKLTVKVGPFGASGQTTFQFVRGEVLNWRMQVTGSLERVLDSVLPHEVNHTIFACHFRRPLPRWADEGAATMFEHISEQRKQLDLLNEVIRNQNELIPLKDLLSMKEYPKGQRAMLTMYAQGYALADFLVQQKGRQAYLDFIGKGELIGWDKAIQAHFDHEGIQKLERNWRGWILAGMPKLTLPREEMLAAESEAQSQEAAHPVLPPAKPVSKPAVRRSSPSQQNVIRSQSPSGSRDASNNVRRGESAETGSRNLRNNVAEPPVQRDYRHSSIIAPAPRAGLNGSHNKSSSGEVPDGRVPASSRSTDTSTERSAEENDRLFSGIKGMNQTSETENWIQPLVQSESIAESNAQLEATGLHLEESAAAEDGAAGFQFDGVLLPRERKESPNLTPQWAGFPGQKKLF
ncbi:MAG: hypothetical protein U0996_09770 [Planctomycetaceae bacterium]